MAKKKKGVTALAHGAPVPPKKLEKPDPKVRRAPITKLQAANLAALHNAVAEAQKADAGVIRAQGHFNWYFSAIVHGINESRPVTFVATERGAGSKLLLAYRIP